MGLLTHNSPKYLEWNLLREIERIFPLKCAILSFGKCLKNEISGIQGADIFELWQYWTEKILSNIFFLFPNGVAGR